MLGTARTVSRATISVRATAVLRDNNNRRRDQISGRRRPCSGDRRRLLVTNYVPTPSRLTGSRVFSGRLCVRGLSFAPPVGTFDKTKQLRRRRPRARVEFTSLDGTIALFDTNVTTYMCVDGRASANNDGPS